MKETYTSKSLSLINIGVVSYFTLLYLVEILNLNFVIIGVLINFLSIPFLLAELLFIFIGIRFLFKKKRSKLFMFSLILLIIFGILTFGSLIL